MIGNQEQNSQVDRDDRTIKDIQERMGDEDERTTPPPRYFAMKT